MNLGPRAKMTFVERLMDKCKYFTGIQHRTCKKSVAYIDVRDSSTSPYRWPCFKSEQSATSCPCAEYPTQEEAQKESDEWDAHIATMLSKIAEGKCPTCDEVVTKKQVGPCVYGSCGHRLYQGRANT